MAETDFDRRIARFVASCLLGLAGSVLVLGGDFAAAQDEAAEDKPATESTAVADDKPAAEPVTAGDPDISIDHLKLRVKPLTRAELAVEAEAWRDLLKAKVQEISELHIGHKERQGQAEDAENRAGQEQPGGEEAQPGGDEQQAAAATQTVQQSQAELAEKLPQLQEERTELIDRLNVVLNAWESKGGEVEEYRQYVTAVSGLDIETADAATAFTLIQGWLTSDQGGVRWAWNIGKFLAILAAFYILALILSSVVRHVAQRIKGASQLLQNFLAGFVKQLVVIVGVIVALSALELNISPLLAAIGGAAFVIGLALQGTLSNFASGLIILGYRPFDVGDVIDAGGVSGIVDSMNLISTRIRTFDNKVMIVPNNLIATDTITNASASETRRVDMIFGIGYQDDIERAKEILESTVQNHPLVLDDPAPVVQLNELADSSVNFICRPWAKSGDYWTVYWDITRTVKQEFDRQGISIPFPQRDIHVYHESAAPTATPT